MTNHKKVELYTSFSKSEKMEADEDGFIYIEGFASTDDVDRHGDIVPAEVWNNKALKNFKKNPIVLYNHNHSAVIGKVVSIEKRENGLFVKCAIDAVDNIGRKVMQGLLRTFSIGFYLLDFDYNEAAEAWVIKALELLEISVVSIPANQDATFSLAKQLGGETEVKELRQKLLGKSFNQQENTRSMEDNRTWFQKTFGLGTTDEEATKALETVAKEKAELEQKVKTLTTELTESNAKAATLEAEKAALSVQVQTLTDAKTALETEAETLNAQTEAIAEEKAALETEVATLKTSVSEKETTIETLNATIAKQKGIKKRVKGGSDPVIEVNGKKKFESPNTKAAEDNLAALKNR